MKVPLLILIFFLLFVFPVEAHSGCCSHHFGVRGDGCGCNDGTPLSSTCAPYYVCTHNDAQIQPTSMTSTQVEDMQPTSKPITIRPKITPTIMAKISPQKILTQSSALTITPTIKPILTKPIESTKQLEKKQDFWSVIFSLFDFRSKTN